jgi:hypothetical protein
MTPKRPGNPNIATGQADEGRFLRFKRPKAGPRAGLIDIVVMLEQWELANFKPEYQFVVRQYDIGKGHSVSVMWRGAEVDTISGFEKEADALEWIKEKSQAWLIDNQESRKKIGS